MKYLYQNMLKLVRDLNLIMNLVHNFLLWEMRLKTVYINVEVSYIDSVTDLKNSEMIFEKLLILN